MDNKKQERKSGGRYKVIFRLDGETAKKLDGKLEGLGLKKQTFFEKLVNQYLNNEISIDGKSDNKIFVEEVENIVKDLIASDSNLLSKLTERVKSLVLEDLKENTIMDKPTIIDTKEVVITKTFEDTKNFITQLINEDKSNSEIVKLLNDWSYPKRNGSVGKWKTNHLKSFRSK